MAESSDGWSLYEELSVRPFGDLGPPEQRLVAFGDLRTEVNNGGFDQYFFNSAGDHAQMATEAARTVGSEELVLLIETAIDILGLGSVTGDRDARQDRLGDLDDSAFETLDERYIALESAQDLDAGMNRLAQQARS
jgi:hypothetical protein